MSIHEALVLAKREIGAIGKNSRNKQQGFSYRGIDDVYNTLHGILANHGIVTVPEVTHMERQERTTKNGTALLYSLLTIRYHFFAEDGSSVTATVVGEGMDSGDKASNKAMSIAHKYALFQVFMIPTEDVVDPDSESHAVQPNTASNESWAKIDEFIEAGAVDDTQLAWLEKNRDTLTEAKAQEILAKLRSKK